MNKIEDNQELILIDADISQQVINNQTDDWELASFNQQWKNYWFDYFQERFKNDVMYQKLLRAEQERDYLIININKIIAINKQLFEENIKHGEDIEKLKSKTLSLEAENKELRKLKGQKPKGFFDTTVKIVAKNIKIKELEEANESLKNSKGQMAAIDPKIVEEILKLKIKGLNYAEISAKTGVSTASISRYINKNKNRLRELEHQTNRN